MFIFFDCVRSSMYYVMRAFWPRRLGFKSILITYNLSWNLLLDSEDSILLRLIFYYHDCFQRDIVQEQAV